MSVHITNILEFMASNGLVANASKTEFMLINGKEKGQKRKIRVGDSLVKQTQSAKLIGLSYHIIKRVDKQGSAYVQRRLACSYVQGCKWYIFVSYGYVPYPGNKNETKDVHKVR